MTKAKATAAAQPELKAAGKDGAGGDAPAEATKRGHDRRFYVAVKTKIHGDNAPTRTVNQLLGFKTRTEMNQFFAQAGSDVELEGEFVIRGYAIPLKQETRVRF